MSGRHTRVTMRDSMTKSVRNNFSQKLPGLVPIATGAWVSAPLLNTKIVFIGATNDFVRSRNPTDWVFRGTRTTLWNNRYVTAGSRIGGMNRIR